MKPLYFGRGARRLFGVYEPALGAAARDEAILLCYPAPQEYMQAHWAFRKLARMLAGEGFHVLRFDYFGTGDSAGDAHEGSLEQWCEDIKTAAGEIRDVSGARQLSAVGFRLGAALAARSALRLRQLVLWEPVVQGAAHLLELRAVHALRFAHCLNPPRLPRRGPMLELLGHALPPALQAGIEQLRLEPPFPCRAERVLIVTSRPASTYQDLASSLGAGASLEPVPEDQADGMFLLSSLAQRRITERLVAVVP